MTTMIMMAITTMRPATAAQAALEAVAAAVAMITALAELVLVQVQADEPLLAQQQEYHASLAAAPGRALRRLHRRQPAAPHQLRLPASVPSAADGPPWQAMAWPAAL